MHVAKITFPPVDVCLIFAYKQNGHALIQCLWWIRTDSFPAQHLLFAGRLLSQFNFYICVCICVWPAYIRWVPMHKNCRIVAEFPQTGSSSRYFTGSCKAILPFHGRDNYQAYIGLIYEIFLSWNTISFACLLYQSPHFINFQHLLPSSISPVASVFNACA